MVDPERAAEIINAARATLERTADIGIKRRSYRDDALTTWRENMPKPEPTRSRPAMTDAVALRMRNALAEAQTQADARFEAVGKLVGTERRRQRKQIDTVKRLSDARFEAVGQVIGVERKRHREQIDAMRKEFAEEIAKVREELSDVLARFPSQRGAGGGGTQAALVTVLPPAPREIRRA
jgi:tRNA G37 N-methylase Trm5